MSLRDPDPEEAARLDVMSDEKPTPDEELRRKSESAEPVPEADALEQTEELEPDEDDLPSDRADVPEADALEQSRAVRHEDDDRR
jgi:hypothetical protein